MKRLFFWGIMVIVITTSCTNKKKIPDVSNINIELKTIRFEQDFFKIDTNNIDANLQKVFSKHKEFTQDFLFNILGASPSVDTAKKNVISFISSYKDLNVDVQKKFQDFTPIETEIKQGLQFVHFYFPSYKLPKKIITFIGPINGYGNIITANNDIAVGLQLYMGKDYPLYNSPQGQAMYPSFISKKFEPDYVSINCIKNIIEDIFVISNNTKTTSGQLIEEMIDEGKKIYILEALLPYKADSLKIGYSQQQLDDCYKREANIWAIFLQNNLLYEIDANRIAPYITDGPNTVELGTDSPGNIGSFIGWQIVKKWMEKNKAITLTTLINTTAKKIFEESKYKPR